MNEVKRHVAFTGHRNRSVPESELDRIAAEFAPAVWHHGNAEGFDTQVDRYAKSHGIEVVRHLPNYKEHGRTAPLVRNQEIVDISEVLVACYDFRPRSGTGFTIDYAQKQEKPVIFLDLIPIAGGDDATDKNPA